MILKYLSALVLLVYPSLTLSRITEELRFEIRPENLLPDHVDEAEVVNPFTKEKGWSRKGVIGATEFNSAQLNELLFKEDPRSYSEYQVIVELIKARLPSLHALGLFHWFSPDEWVSNETQPGRVLIGVLYLQLYPERYSAMSTKEKLAMVLCKIPSLPLWQEVAKLNKEEIPICLPPYIERLKSTNKLSDKKTEMYSMMTEQQLLPDRVNTIEFSNPFTGEKGVVRKATVNSLMNHIACLDHLLLEQNAKEKEITILINSSKELMPFFHVTGVFDWFSPEEWISDQYLGRTLMVLIYLESYRYRLDGKIVEKLEMLKERVPHPQITSRINLLLSNL